MIKGHAPGTILQFMFIRNRLRKLFDNTKNVIEVGSGNGHLSNLLLQSGYSGVGIDLNKSACDNNEILNRNHIVAGKYQIINGDFNTVNDGSFDFLISSMVIEHICDNNLKKFIENAKRLVKEDGRLIFLVPSNMKAWGIEDEIAGHIKRYTFSEIEKLAKSNNLKVKFKCGLNYPISNMLLSLSNNIVSKKEGHLREKTDLEKTVYTGNRNVKYKTIFPTYLNVVLNELMMLPFSWLQKLNAKNEKSLVMYFELTK